MKKIKNVTKKKKKKKKTLFQNNVITFHGYSILQKCKTLRQFYRLSKAASNKIIFDEILLQSWLKEIFSLTQICMYVYTVVEKVSTPSISKIRRNFRKWRNTCRINSRRPRLIKNKILVSEVLKRVARRGNFKNLNRKVDLVACS